MTSGLQKEVLALYRRALRLVRTKPPQAQPSFTTFIRFKFHQNARNISPRAITAIEHLIRKGRRQIKEFEDPAMKDCWVGQNMKDWATRNPSRRRGI